jgi:hypothetical protein
MTSTEDAPGTAERRSPPASASVPRAWKLRRRLRVRLARWPRLSASILRAWRSAKWGVARTRWAIAAKRRDSDSFLDVRDLLTVSPREIRLCSLTEFNPEKTRGRAVDGDWDLSSKEFDALDISVAVRQVFIEGLPWETTGFYGRLLEDLDRGSQHWGITARADVDERCRAIAHLYESIKSQGYLTSRQVQLSTHGTLPPLDEIAVAIGRDGQMLFANSAHRLALAKLLDITEIPVVVAVRHPRWIAFRKDVERSVRTSGGAACQPPQHPDLVRVPAHHECERQFELIKEHTTSHGGELLDVGAQWGYFCHRFEELGFSCTGMEDIPEDVYFMTRLRDARGRRFRVIPMSILQEEALEDREYSVVLALNVFHRFLKRREDFRRFESLLSRLRASELFLEPHLDGAAQMNTEEVHMSAASLVEFVAERMRMPNVEHLGEAADGRPLYRLARV